MTNAQRFGAVPPLVNNMNSVALNSHTTTWSIAARSAARLAQPHNPVVLPTIAAAVTNAPVNWESIRNHRRR